MALHIGSLTEISAGEITEKIETVYKMIYIYIQRARYDSNQLCDAYIYIYIYI